MIENNNRTMVLSNLGIIAQTEYSNSTFVKALKEPTHFDSKIVPFSSIYAEKHSPYIKKLILNEQLIDKRKKVYNLLPGLVANVSLQSDPFNGFVIEDPLFIYVKSNVPVDANYPTVEPLKIIVERTIPPIFDPTGSGAGLINLKYSFYKNTFIEIFFNFEDTFVEEIIGIPKNLEFDKDRKRLFGVCIVAGTFNIQLKMNNGHTLEGVLKIYNLEREL